jgi:hypothetical protein
MTTGSAKTKIPAGNRATGLQFRHDRLVVALHDGREVHVPLSLYPTLQSATATQRQAWQMIGPGKAFHWPQLDLDLSVDGLINGLREAIPRPPRLKKRQIA